MVNQKKDKEDPKSNRWDWLENRESANINPLLGNHDKNKKFSFLNFPQVKPSLLVHETPKSLDGKIPMVPGPTDFVVLSTTKLGTKRFVVPPDAEFDLNDPNHGPGGPHQGYNFLHDPHLYEYLNTPAVRKTLVEKGLITKDGDVKCTIKEFNEYRQWIRKLKLDAIDQEWHLKQAELCTKEKKKPCNSEISQLSKQRQQRAKELYKQKEQKREQERLRYLRLAEEKEIRVEEMKERVNEKYKERRKTHNMLLKIRIARKNVRERESKKIHLKVLNEGKESVKKRQARIQSFHHEKLTEKETKAMELWRRRQGYSMAQMKELRSNQKKEKKVREKHIKRRESVYLKDRRKSEAHALQYSTANRENALRHLQEADEYMQRREARKAAKVEKWKQRLHSLEAREQLLHYYRQKREYEQKYGKAYPKSKARQSVWDIDRSLLKQVMGGFTNEEQMELASYCEELSENSSGKMSILHESEGDASRTSSKNRKELDAADDGYFEEPKGEVSEAEVERNDENGKSDFKEIESIMSDTRDCSRENLENIEVLAVHESHVGVGGTSANNSYEVIKKVSKNKSSHETIEELNRSSMHLDIATLGKDRPSFIDFGNIQADVLQSVYHEGRRLSLPSTADDHRSCITQLEVPGVIIEHTQSRTGFEPCVFDVEHEITSSSESETEEIVKLESQTSLDHGWGKNTQSSFEILGNSSKESGIKSVEPDFCELPPLSSGNSLTGSPLTQGDCFHSQKSLVSSHSLNDVSILTSDVSHKSVVRPPSIQKDRLRSHKSLVGCSHKSLVGSHSLNDASLLTPDASHKSVISSVSFNDATLLTQGDRLSSQKSLNGCSHKSLVGSDSLDSYAIATLIAKGDVTRKDKSLVNSASLDTPVLAKGSVNGSHTIFAGSVSLNNGAMLITKDKVIGSHKSLVSSTSLNNDTRLLGKGDVTGSHNSLVSFASLGNDATVMSKGDVDGSNKSLIISTSLNDADKLEKEVLFELAKNIVKESLASAAKSAGFSNKRIKRTLGMYFDASGFAVFDADADVSKSSMSHSSNSYASIPSVGARSVASAALVDLGPTASSKVAINVETFPSNEARSVVSAVLVDIDPTASSKVLRSVASFPNVEARSVASPLSDLVLSDSSKKTQNTASCSSVASAALVEVGPTASAKIPRSTASSVVSQLLSNKPLPLEISDSIQSLAKDFVETSMIGTAIALGYTSEEVAGALEMKKGRESLQWDDLPEEYDSCIRRVTKEALFQAGKLLGFDKSQTEKALLNTELGEKLEKKDSIVSFSASITKIGKEFAESAVNQVIRDLVPEGVEQVSITYHKEIEERLSRPSTQMSLYSLDKPQSISIDLSKNSSSMIAHNALRSAAMALGYTPDEVDKKIGMKKSSSTPDESDKKSGMEGIRTLDQVDKDIGGGSSRNIDEGDKTIGMEKSSSTPNEVDKEQCLEESSLITIDEINSRLSLPRAYSEKSALKSVEEWASKSNPSNIPDGSFMSSSEGSSECLVDDLTGHDSKPSNDVFIEQSKLLVQGCLQKAILQLSLQTSELVCLTPEPSIEQITEQTEDEKLKVIANSLVADVIGRASGLVKEERRKAAKCEDKKLKTASLKLSMLIIGSVARASGHSDVEIVRALDRDRQESYRLKRRDSLERYQEALSGRGARRPSMMKSSWGQRGERRLSLQGGNLSSNVKFNETSITEARRASLSLPQGRRASLRERPLTPKPRSSTTDVGLLDDNNESRVHFDSNNTGIDYHEKEAQTISEDVVGITTNAIPKKVRRPSPYVSTVAHKKVVQEIKSNIKLPAVLMEEGDTEDSSNEDNQDNENKENSNYGANKEVVEIGNQNDDDFIINEEVDETVGQNGLPSWQQEIINQVDCDKKWSGEFLNKVSSIVDYDTMQKNTSNIIDFSEETEANMLCRIENEIKQNKIREYPTEVDFLQRLSKENDPEVLPKLDGLVTKDLNPGLLDLYGMIQQDIENILDHQEKMDKSSDINNPLNNLGENILEEENDSSRSSSSSYCSLPKIEATSQVSLTGRNDSVVAINSSESKNNDVHLPSIVSKESIKSDKSNVSSKSSRISDGPLPPVFSSNSSRKSIEKHFFEQYPVNLHTSIPYFGEAVATLARSDLIAEKSSSLATILSVEGDGGFLKDLDGKHTTPDSKLALKTKELEESGDSKLILNNAKLKESPHSMTYTTSLTKSASDKDAHIGEKKPSLEKPRLSCSMSHIQRRLSQQSSNAKGSNYSAGSKASADSKESQKSKNTMTDSSNSNSSMKLKNRLMNFIEKNSFNNNGSSHFATPMKLHNGGHRGSLGKVLSLHNLHSHSSFVNKSAGEILDKSSGVPKKKPVFRSSDHVEKLSRSSKSFNVTRETRSNLNTSSEMRTRSRVSGLLKRARSGPRRSSRSFQINKDIDKVMCADGTYSYVSNTKSVHQMADVSEESDLSKQTQDLDLYIDALDGTDSEPEEVEERELCSSVHDFVDEGINENISVDCIIGPEESSVLCEILPEQEIETGPINLYVKEDENNKVGTVEKRGTRTGTGTKTDHSTKTKSLPVIRPKKISVLNMSLAYDLNISTSQSKHKEVYPEDSPIVPEESNHSSISSNEAEKRKGTHIVPEKSSHSSISSSRKSVSYSRLPGKSSSSVSRKESVTAGRANSAQNFLPSPPLSKRGSRIFGSRSLNLVNKRSSRTITRSKSLGASRKLNSNDSLEKFPFNERKKEVIPMIGEGELSETFKELKSNSPMTNDVKTVKSAVKSTASLTMWNPGSSLVSLDKEPSPFSSTTTVIVQPQPQPSRNISMQSAHSGKGPIVVAPAESVSFVPNAHEPRKEPADSVPPMKEEIQRQFSGTTRVPEDVIDSEKLDNNQ